MRVAPFPLPEPRVFAWLRRITISAAVAYGLLFSWGLYRRLIQVQRIEIVAAPRALHAGDTVTCDVITSGEVHNLIRLELVQGDKRVALREFASDINRINTLDPRLFHYRPAIVVEPAMLAGFAAGPATLRLTVFGSRKLLRIPAPRIREVAVEVRP